MKKIIIISVVAIILLSTTKVKSEEILIPDEALRLRVIANSNSKEDQNSKFKISEEVEKEISNILKNTETTKEAKEILSQNLNKIDEKIKTTIEENKYPFDYKLELGLNYFPKKEYKGITYKEGYYDSLVITLGKGEGNNWWCVLFPPLCLMEAEETNTNEVEYKFFIKEILDKYFN